MCEVSRHFSIELIDICGIDKMVVEEVLLFRSSLRVVHKAFSETIVEAAKSSKDQ